VKVNTRVALHHAKDAVRVFVESVVRELVLNEEQNQNEGGQTGRQSKDI
jgi:hypothetical protein